MPNLIVGLLLVTLCTKFAYAAECPRYSYAPSGAQNMTSNAGTYVDQITNSATGGYCSGTTPVYYANYTGAANHSYYIQATECKSCSGLATLSQQSFSVPSGIQAAFNCDSSYYNYCKCSISTTYGAWTDYTTGTQRRLVQTPTTGCTYTETYEYRCTAGYYANSTQTACIKCDPDEYGNAATSPVGSTDISACYIPNGTTFSNDTGSGTYTADCDY